MNKSIKGIVVSSLALALIAGIVTAALAGTNALTEQTIKAREEQTENVARRQVLDAEAFEEKTFETTEGKVTYYEAVKAGESVGYVFTTVATGKSSGLTVLTGITKDGRISGVAVTSDNETAGYDDKVKKGGLLDTFQGKDAKPLQFGVDVDGVSQATKTSKGITTAVNMAVSYYQQITTVQSDGAAWQTKGGSDE